MKLFKKCTAEPHSILVNNRTLPLENGLGIKHNHLKAYN